MRSPATLRSKLMVLLLGTTLPLLVMALVNVWISDRAERDRLDRSTETVARGVALGVALEIQRGLAGLNALALSRPLCAGDLRAFTGQLTRFMEAQHPGGNAVLADTGGQQLVNLLAPPGEQLPRRRNLDLLQESFARASPVVSNVYGGTYQDRVVTLEVPVYCKGIARYNLSLAPRLEVFETVLREQRPPQDWSLVLLDAQEQVVARTGVPVASSAPPMLAPGFLAGGFIPRAAQHDGGAVTLAYSPVGDFGWRVMIQRPLDNVRAGLVRSVLLLVAGTLLVVAIGAAFALATARTVVRPMERLSRLAKESGGMARGAVLPASGVREIDIVAIRLQDALRQQQLADRHKDDFIATLAHELRNPLAPLTNALALLQRKERLSGEGERLTQIAQRQLAQMKRLVHDLLELSRLGQGKLSIELRRMDLRDPVGAAVESLSARLKEKHQSLSVHLPSEPMEVQGDEQRLAQVFSNLLDNASKYSLEGASVRIQVGIEGERIRVDIQDDGLGLDPVQAAHVFDMYWQAGTADGAAGSGLGIGLALVRRIVEAHRGAVQAASEGLGRGCMFTVWLPRFSPIACAQEGPM